MDAILSFISNGFAHASWGQMVLYTLVTTHISIVAVTLFLHRCQAHRSLELHPVVMHFFRFWLWVGTGMVTKEWVAIHRKHHSKCEREGDPHSPRLFGVWKVLFQGTELYRQESVETDTLTRFGHGTPDDWLERNLYTRHSLWGVMTLLTLDLLLFGALGLTIWAVQMAWIPFWAAGVINGIGHYFGYRNYATPDTSSNIFPLGLLIGGEELHNNHHAYGTSAKFSKKWYEFDLGWGYLCILRFLRLAKVKRVAPKLKLGANKPIIDLSTLQGIMTHRYEVMARYAEVIKTTGRQELAKLKSLRWNQDGNTRWTTLHCVRSWLHRSEDVLQPEQVAAVDRAIANHQSLSTLVQMRRELGRLWESSSATSEQLLHHLQTWCQHAQQSGIEGLEQFADRLRRYAA